MKTKFIILLCLIFAATSRLISQEYIGAGNDNGITVTTSNQYQDDNWLASANAQNTINGNGLDGKLMEASRFLAQATMGYDMSDMEAVVSMGIEEWIDDQIEQPITYTLPEVEYAWQAKLSIDPNTGGKLRPTWQYFDYGWWHVTMTNQDQLRHRIAYALTQTFVVSHADQNQVFNHGDGLAAYYDMLLENAFGNFRDLLEEVTYSPMMGYYLTYLNNPKADTLNNIRPDENYAREIMQLFSIGLYELNLDGTLQTDDDGAPIQTYGQDEIREFAKIFTGLSIGGILPAGTPAWNNGVLEFGKDLSAADGTVPMIMYDEWHDTGTKNLLNGYVVPAGQTGDEDIDDAIDNLFNHPNVGPFITYRLIQRLVKSNPSPAYVQRVATTFNDNGLGVRGDMAAVVKAIFMDAEARECSYLQHVENSRLREPFVRYTQFARALDKTQTINGKYWNEGSYIWNDARQSIFAARSVFNFYTPDHAPGGDIANAGLVAPEFKLHDTRNSIRFINWIFRWTWNYYGAGGAMLRTYYPFGSDYETEYDTNRYKEFAKDPEALINELDRTFTHGRLSDHTREILRSAAEDIQPPYGDLDNDDYLEDRVYVLTYLLLISSDYAVMR